MTNRLLVAGLLIGAALSSGAASAGAPFSLKSVTVDLPYGETEFPGGAAATAINKNCTACHSPGMVLNQPNLPKATWEGVVHKMIAVYKAPVPDEDVPAIVAYLASTKGAQ